MDYADEIKSIEQYILDISPDKNQREFNFLYRILPSKKFKLSKSLIHNSLVWCKKNLDKKYGLWNLNKLICKNFNKSMTEKFIEILELFLSTINPKELTEEDCSTINCILYKLIKTVYNDKKLYLRTLNCFLRCLQDNCSFAKNIHVYEGIQDRIFFFALGHMLKRNILKIDKNHEEILNYMKWFMRWNSQNKTRVKRELYWLRSNYPSEFWNSV